MQYTGFVSCVLLSPGLHARFTGLLTKLNITSASPSSVTDTSKNLGFDDDIFLMAASLDPNFGFRWLEDLPHSLGAKEELRQNIIGICQFCMHGLFQV